MSAAWGRALRSESDRCLREAGRHGKKALQRIGDALNPPAVLHPIYGGDVDRFVEDMVRCAKYSAQSAAHYARMAGYGR